MKHKLLTDENYKKCAEIFGNENCYFEDGWTLDDEADINMQLEREKHKANPGEIIKVLFDVIDEYKRRIAERD
ncbi:TPA: hypothetical protein ACOTGY_002889 [Clostridium perfringens]|uniref:hypothetical protein n=1 Tax=Clostridium perfringens TaxID=1502 RepID=UPI0024BC6F34|nr:hypothetical protein [Clostridium perfringens]